MKILCALLCMAFAINLPAQQKNIKIHLNHTAIYVVDLAKTGNFYSTIIGIDSIPEPFHDGKHIWYKTADHMMLHVIQGAVQKKEYYKNQHTCFTVSDFNGFIAKLKSANWPYEDGTGTKNAVTTRIDGIHQIWVQDPDGYWIEINDDNY